jgi:MFS family permease
MAARSAPPEQMASAIGAVQTGAALRPAIGPAIGGVLASAFGLRNAFLVSSLVYVIAFVMLTVMYKERRDEVVEPARGRGARELFERAGVRELRAPHVGDFCVASRGPQLRAVLLLHVTQIGYAPGRAELLVGVLFSALLCQRWLAISSPRWCFVERPPAQ